MEERVFERTEQVPEFKNGSGHAFTDISSEMYREYTYSDGGKIFIDKPLKLHVSKSGGHRIFSQDGLSHYVNSGWRMISWRSKDGEFNFVK